MSTTNNLKHATGSEECRITINGVELDFAQSMAVRCAITSYNHEMSESGCLGNDEHGEIMRKAYLRNTTAVLDIMFRFLTGTGATR